MLRHPTVPTATASSVRRVQPSAGMRSALIYVLLVLPASSVREVHAHRVFPFAVGQLTYVGTVTIHQEYLRVWLRRGVVQRGLILEAGARALEPDFLSVGRPGRVRVRTSSCGQTPDVGAVRLHGEHLEVCVRHPARED